MMRMLPVFRSAKKIRPSDANARAIGHAKPVCTGPSRTAGLFGVPPPGRWTQYQAYARPARVAIAAMTTVAIIKRVRGCMKPEHHSLVKRLAVRSLTPRARRGESASPTCLAGSGATPEARIRRRIREPTDSRRSRSPARWLLEADDAP